MTETNTGTGDPADGRVAFDWVSKYPPEARNEIKWETIYLLFIFFSALALLFATWKGWVCLVFSASPGETDSLRKYAFYASSGMLGGITFGMKYFYRVVARGYWHQDRRIWRILSPLMALAVSIVVGAMIDASLITAKKPISSALVVSIGFLAGYFADEAVGKMYEIASVIFGKSAMTKSGAERPQHGKQEN